MIQLHFLLLTLLQCSTNSLVFTLFIILVKLITYFYEKKNYETEYHNRNLKKLKKNYSFIETDKLQTLIKTKIHFNNKLFEEYLSYKINKG